jgi:uncharacterized protein YrzB (UPF0473 family)
MKMTRILGAALVLLSVKSMFSQGEISIKNHPEVHLVLNNNYSIRYDQNLRLFYEKVDSVTIGIQTEGYMKKIISLEGSQNYEVLKSSRGLYRLRLRSNTQIENFTEILLDTLTIHKLNNASLIAELEKQEYEYDKVNLLCAHLRKQKENNENLVEYLSVLSHDFSKWQVIEVVLKEKLMQIDYSKISETFDSNIYKERLKSLLEIK